MLVNFRFGGTSIHRLQWLETFVIIIICIVIILLYDLVVGQMKTMTHASMDCVVANAEVN